MVRATVWNGPRPISELPGDKDSALAASLHAAKTLVKARNGAADTLMERKGLGFAHLGFAVGAQNWFAILVSDRRSGVIVGGVEFDAIGGTVTGVMDLQQLAWFGRRAGADLDFQVTQGDREYRLLDSLVHGNIGRRLDVPGNVRISWKPGFGCWNSGLRRSGLGNRFSCGSRMRC